MDIGVLDGGRLAGGLVDGVDRDVAFAAAEHHDATNILNSRADGSGDARAIAVIDEPPFG